MGVLGSESAVVRGGVAGGVERVAERGDAMKAVGHMDLPRWVGYRPSGMRWASAAPGPSAWDVDAPLRSTLNCNPRKGAFEAPRTASGSLRPERGVGTSRGL